MEENYLYSKRIVEERFSSDDPFYPIYVLGIFSLLQKYPNHQDIIHSLFLDLNLIIEEDTILNIVRKHNLDYQDFDQEEEMMKDSDEMTLGISSPGKFFQTEDNHLVETTDQPILILTSLCRDEYLLNLFVHEMNHLIKSKINAYKITRNESLEYCSIRNGLHVTVYEYYPDRDTVVELDSYNILDEAINTIQTTEMLSSVLSLDGIIPDKTIQEFLNHCNLKLLREDCGYQRVVKLFRPLWEVEDFRSVVEDNLVEGNLSPIWQHYDSIMGENEFERLADLLDELDEVECASGSIRKIFILQNRIRNKVNEYCKKMKTTYHK